MSHLLIQDAIIAVWGAPDPLNQVILNPDRITPYGGAQRAHKQPWTTYSLPDTTTRFHLYQIGNIYPSLISLTNITDTWQLVSNVCTQTEVLCDLYTNAGLMVPKTRSWVKITTNKNILFAIEHNPRLRYDFNQDEIYIRLYRNAYYELAGLSADKQIVIGGGRMESFADITALQQTYSALALSPEYKGGLCAYCNGIKITTISVATVMVGDVAEFVYDGSVYKVIDFKVTDLPSFTSSIDRKGKSLLHYDAQSLLVDYLDEIDLYLVDSTTQQGVYVHKNAVDTLRMVTYKDYSLATGYLAQYVAYLERLQGRANLASMWLRMYVRASGYVREPILESSASHYLMKLTSAQQIAALIGAPAGPLAWRADQLEASSYLALMRATRQQITPSLVELAYGATHTQSVLASNPIKVAGTGIVAVPPAFQRIATAFEYDVYGKLLGYYPVGHGELEYAYHTGCALVEFIAGVGDRLLDEDYSADPVVLSAHYNYRFYINVIEPGSQAPIWQDVSLQTEHVLITEDRAVWQLNTSLPILKRLARSDRTFLLYQTNVFVQAGTLMHTLQYFQDTPSGRLSASLSVPLGELDVWLNGHPMISGIDYIIKANTISIISVAAINDIVDPQVLTIRHTGFCSQTLQRTPIGQVGFVHQGSVSVNGQYNLNDSRVSRVVVGGALMSTDQITYLEDGVAGSLTNGQPYQLRDYRCPMWGLLEQDPYRYYEATAIQEATVAEYMTRVVPQILTQPISTIVQRYQLVSPFLARIAYDLKKQFLIDSRLTLMYSDSVVRELCRQYEYLLALDPIAPGNTPDLRYCTISAHWDSNPTSLLPDDYRFMMHVIRLYAYGLVDSTNQFLL